MFPSSIAGCHLSMLVCDDTACMIYMRYVTSERVSAHIYTLTHFTSGDVQKADITFRSTYAEAMSYQQCQPLGFALLHIALRTASLSSIGFPQGGTQLSLVFATDFKSLRFYTVSIAMIDLSTLLWSYASLFLYEKYGQNGDCQEYTLNDGLAAIRPFHVIAGRPIQHEATVLGHRFPGLRKRKIMLPINIRNHGG
jgi:hypothetical protein